MELWEIYDKDRNRTGKTKVRGEKFNEGEYHLVVHICIFDSEGRMLIQQRQPFKQGWSNLFDITVGGSALHGENSQEAAERELMEEIGYHRDFSNERPFMTLHFGFGFDDIYIIEEDIQIETLTLQEEEVQLVKWATEEEVLALIEQGAFIPYYKSLIQLLFEMRKRLGAISVL